MRRRLVAETAIIVVAGTLLHFTYDWSGGNRFVGFISPINESVWEHTKLLVVPVVVLGAIGMWSPVDGSRTAWATLSASALGALAIIMVFYAYTGALGVSSILWVDISSFVLVVIAAQWLKARMIYARGGNVPPVWVSVAGLVILAALYVLWTLTPPELPVFQPEAIV